MDGKLRWIAFATRWLVDSRFNFLSTPVNARTHTFFLPHASLIYNLCTFISEKVFVFFSFNFWLWQIEFELFEPYLSFWEISFRYFELAKLIRIFHMNSLCRNIYEIRSVLWFTYITFERWLLKLIVTSDLHFNARARETNILIYECFKMVNFCTAYRHVFAYWKVCFCSNRMPSNYLIYSANTCQQLKHYHNRISCLLFLFCAVLFSFVSFIAYIFGTFRRSNQNQPEIKYSY